MLVRRPNTLHDFSAVITGALLAFTLPVNIPLWVPAVGSAFAIIVAKLAFGGLGNNIMNPALAGRAFLALSYPAAFAVPAQSISSGPSGLGATLLGVAWGNAGEPIGGISSAALLLGAVVLSYRHIVSLRISLACMASAFVFSWAFNGTGEHFSAEAFAMPLHFVFAGSMVLGAWFMATDPVTAPATPTGRLLYGTGIGFLAFALNRFGGRGDGIWYAIILLNISSPLLERFTRPRYLGERTHGV
jgi:electron transport complex protein RnfD